MQVTNNLKISKIIRECVYTSNSIISSARIKIELSGYKNIWHQNYGYFCHLTFNIMLDRKRKLVFLNFFPF